MKISSLAGMLVLALMMVTVNAHAAIDAYSFPNDEMQDRYNQLIDELRCPQCLNTNLAGSDSMIARDLRREVHRLLLEGKSDEEILEFMHQRYGDFILYKPRLKAGTLLLWFGPGVLLLIAIIIGVKFIRNRQTAEAELTAEDEERLEKLLGDKKS
ncbi:MAG: cytochrome c-type biogenesis protein CcmH [Pseudomonadales bacterium]|nr:cytochrome c-type biogenesis protein CcmH [Pseudomonadales bacterium]